jgi:hypothetical protein
MILLRQGYGGLGEVATFPHPPTGFAGGPLPLPKWERGGSAHLPLSLQGRGRGPPAKPVGG